jgi:Reverse transcriptase (RNA-dependent DNA polymerase).
METIKNAVPQGSIQGIRLFLLYINDLPLRINISSKALLYADDTSVSISDTTIHEVQTKSIIALDNINKWFMHTGLSLNLREKKPNNEVTAHMLVPRYARTSTVELYFTLKLYSDAFWWRPPSSSGKTPPQTKKHCHYLVMHTYI